MVSRRGFSFLEVLVALLMLGAAGFAGAHLVNTSARTGADGSAAELASIQGAQVMDRMLGSGYRLLAAKLKQGDAQGELDLAGLDGVPTPGAQTHDDRLRLTGTYRFAEPTPGLIRVEIALAWPRGGQTEPGTLTLVRYLGDPLHGADVNAPFGGKR